MISLTQTMCLIPEWKKKKTSAHAGGTSLCLRLIAFLSKRYPSAICLLKFLVSQTNPQAILVLIASSQILGMRKKKNQK